MPIKKQGPFLHTNYGNLKLPSREAQKEDPKPVNGHQHGPAAVKSSTTK